MAIEKLNTNKIALGQSARTIWHITAPLDATIEDVTDPSFWGHVAMKLRPSDRIEVDREDGSWLCDLRVNACGDTWAKVIVTIAPKAVKISKQENPDDVDPRFDVVFRGPEKYSVIRKKDKAVVDRGRETKEEAMTWLKDHLKTVDA